MREKNYLEKLGTRVSIMSTRPPIIVESEAQHSWGTAAKKETYYLVPLSPSTLIKAVGSLLASGPRAWLKCFKVVTQSDDSLQTKLKLPLFFLFGALLKEQAKAQKLEHIHVHSCANAANVALFAQLLGGVPYSITLHGPLEDYGKNQAAKWHHAAFAIVITQELMDEVTQVLGQGALPPVFIAPMGVDIEAFARSSDYIPPRQGQTLQLVSCGRIHPGKAHDDLLRAVALLKERGITAHLKVCGAPDVLNFSEDYFASLKQLAQELDVRDQVEWLGSVSEEQVKQTLEEAHVFCLASLKEPLGVATMEAMAMAMPVVVTASPGVKEMVSHQEDGLLVEPRAPETFADAIEWLVAHPEQSLRMAKAARDKIAGAYHSGISAETIFTHLPKSD